MQKLNRIIRFSNKSFLKNCAFPKLFSCAKAYTMMFINSQWIYLLNNIDQKNFGTTLFDKDIPPYILAHSISPVLRKFRSKFITDRQTNSLTPYTGVCGFFLQVKFATSLLTLFAGDKTLTSIKFQLNFLYSLN